MIDGLKQQVDDMVNNNKQNLTEEQVEEIADNLRNLPGFDFYKGDDISSVDSDVFWSIVEAVDDGEQPKLERDWRDPE